MYFFNEHIQAIRITHVQVNIHSLESKKQYTLKLIKARV